MFALLLSLLLPIMSGGPVLRARESVMAFKCSDFGCSGRTTLCATYSRFAPETGLATEYCYTRI